VSRGCGGGPAGLDGEPELLREPGWDGARIGGGSPDQHCLLGGTLRYLGWTGVGPAGPGVGLVGLYLSPHLRELPAIQERKLSPASPVAEAFRTQGRGILRVAGLNAAGF
jgi:hypothetical protein